MPVTLSWSKFLTFCASSNTLIITIKTSITFQGPLNVFNAKIKYNSPKTVTINRDEHRGLGISVRGSGPTIISKTSPTQQVQGNIASSFFRKGSPQQPVTVGLY